MKKFIKFIALLAVPFLLVWMAYFLTGFAFNPQDVFRDTAFWGFGAMYWFLSICLLGIIIEFI